MEESTITDVYATLRQHSLTICEGLKTEDYVLQPISDVSPPKWHLGHTSWFFENFVLAKHSDYKIYNPNFHEIFNSYYKSQGSHWAQAQRGHLSRPTVDEILDYRKHVDMNIVNFIGSNQCNNEALSCIELGINHEEQHQELLLMDIKYILAEQPCCDTNYRLHLGFDEKKSTGPTHWIAFDKGLYDFGAQGEGFFYDHEGPPHKHYINAFEISSQLVSSKEFLDFIHDGGYSNPDLWLSDGWDYIQSNNITSPLYWKRGDAGWSAFSLSGWRPLNIASPVCHISFFEAAAYARWANARLPTEWEWSLAATKKKEQFSDLENALWQWTASSYLPFPGYHQQSGAWGEYNGKFMSSQMVLKGGSFATPNRHYRSTYRNFFNPSKRWAFCGLRLARDL